ncbi:hypothetical protein HN51_012114 [Arachis hypogaea]
MSKLGGGNCFWHLLLGVNVGLALVEGIVAFVALFQVLLLFLSCFNSRRHYFSDMKLVCAFANFRGFFSVVHNLDYLFSHKLRATSSSSPRWPSVPPSLASP